MSAESWWAALGSAALVAALRLIDLILPPKGYKLRGSRLWLERADMEDEDE